MRWPQSNRVQAAPATPTPALIQNKTAQKCLNDINAINGNDMYIYYLILSICTWVCVYVWSNSNFRASIILPCECVRRPIRNNFQHTCSSAHKIWYNPSNQRNKNRKFAAHTTTHKHTHTHTYNVNVAKERNIVDGSDNDSDFSLAAAALFSKNPEPNRAT